MDLGYEFRDRELLELALTHASSQCGRDNERLEFLGDAALSLFAADELYQALPTLAEGPLTELKAEIVSRRTLAHAARRLGLEGAAHVGASVGRRTYSTAVLANLFEAVLGAIWLDGGPDAARAFVRATLADELLRAKERRTRRNPKQELQHFAQSSEGRLPRYVQLEARGHAHARAFLMAVELQARRFPSAWGRTRKEAESWAAFEALLVLEHEGRIARPGAPTP